MRRGDIFVSVVILIGNTVVINATLKLFQIYAFILQLYILG